MADSIGPARDEQQFDALFQALLSRAVELVLEEGWREALVAGDLIRGGLNAFLVRKAHLMTEAEECFQLALASPTLHPITWDAARKPIHDVGVWMQQTLSRAVARYLERVPPTQSASDIRIDSRRLRRVTKEVIDWAKLEIVPVVTTTALRGISVSERCRFPVDEDTTLRALTREERSDLSPELFGPIQIPEGPCLVATEYVPRLERPTPSPPRLFLQALQLILERPVEIGASSTRAAVPTFSLSNLGQLGGPLSSRMYLPGPPVAYGQLRRARNIASAFADLSESGFDLALDLYELFLRRPSRRERAVDIAIALENLYLSGVSGELAHRFQLHVATFARRLRRRDRVEMRKARDLYSARSKVVHGARPSSVDIDLLSKDGASLVRNTLLAIVSKRNRDFLRGIEREVAAALGAR